MAVEVNVSKLKGKIVEKGMNVETVAKRIGIERSSLYRKLNNFEKITIGEARKLKDVLELSDEEASAIFFA